MASSKDYRAIAASKIRKPSTVKRLPNFLIYGRNKKGKSTFGTSAGIDNTLVIDPEHGTDEMKAADPNVWPIERWEDMDDVLGYLRLGDHPYDWVCVDGLTRLSNMALKFVMKLAEERSLDRQPGIVNKQDYGKGGELMKEMITAFHNLPQGVVFTAQERMFEAADSEEDEDVEDSAMIFIPDLPKGVRGHVESLVDVIGRIYVAKVVLNEGTEKERTIAQRRLWIGETVKYTTGSRSDYKLPDMLKLPTVPKLVELMRTGQVTTKKRASTPQE